MEDFGNKIASGTGSQDLGPRGRTPLRLILTPPPPPPPPSRVEISEPPLQEYGAPPVIRQKSRTTFDLLRRDTIIRMLLGSPLHALVFVTFSEFSTTPMATQDDLRDEERAGGFGDTDDDDTFQSAAPEPAKLIAAEPVPRATALIPDEPVVVKPARFPYKVVLIGLPLLMLLGAGIVLMQWRHDMTKVQTHEIQLTPEASSTPAQTVGTMPPLPASQPVPVAAPPVAPPVAIPAPIETPKKTSVVKLKSIDAIPYDAAATSAANEGVAVPVGVAVSGSYVIQILATPSEDEANHRAAVLHQQHGVPTFVTPVTKNDMTLYRVRVGPFSSEIAAKSAMRSMGLKSAWITTNQ